MSDNQPFIRNIELFIGPLTEQEGGGPTNQALRIVSDGSREDLRISFDVKKTLLSAPNASTVSIYNLARGTRERIRASLARVKMNVGYTNVGVSTLAQGGSLSVTTEKRSTDYITNIRMLDGFGGQLNGIANDTFEGGINISSIVRSLAEKMPGVSIGRIDIDGLLGSRGRTFSGTVAEELSGLADQYGFSWSIQNGVFQALSDVRSFARTRLISFRDRSLVSAVPLLNGPLQQETGVEIVGILDPRVSPGDRVQLESQVNPQLNGFHKVHEVDFNGDTYDRSWLMTIRSYKIL